MTSYWNLSKEQQDRLESIGVDYDLQACLEYNPQPFDLLDIENVLAVWEGENDGDDWRWVIRFKDSSAKKHDSRYVFLQGGCDYTGWDCQSGADCSFHKKKREAARAADPGFGYVSNGAEVVESLLKQVQAFKLKTWREKMDKELGVGDLPKIV